MKSWDSFHFSRCERVGSSGTGTIDFPTSAVKAVFQIRHVKDFGTSAQIKNQPHDEPLCPLSPCCRMLSQHYLSISFAPFFSLKGDFCCFWGGGGFPVVSLVGGIENHHRCGTAVPTVACCVARSVGRGEKRKRVEVVCLLLLCSTFRKRWYEHSHLSERYFE